MDELDKFPEIKEKTYKLKVILVGPWGVGKTSLARKYVEQKFEQDYLPTIGASVMIKKIVFKGPDGEIHIHLAIWDIAAQEMFKSMREGFYSGANGALVVADLSRIQSFTEVQEWVEELRLYHPSIPVVFLANKCDLEYSLDDAMLQDIEYSLRSIRTYKTSAIDGTKVQEAFEFLTRIMIPKMNPEIS